MSDILEEMLASVKLGPARPAHQAVIDRIQKNLLEKYTRHSQMDWEVKRSRITHFCGTTTYMTIEVGLVGDEGTYAEFFGRDYRHIKIGKRGGVELLNGTRPSYRYGMNNAIYQPTKG
jgi:hypothetical protein